MEIRTKKIGKDIWRFVNETWSTSNAWGHRTVVFKNNFEYLEHKVRYYNRTWESYTYQTCMYSAINEIYEKEENKFINDYKRKNDIDRFKKGQKDVVIKLFKQTDIARSLNKLKKTIDKNEFNM